MVTIIDLGMGNLQSVANAFNRVGAEVSIARTAEAAENASILVLPGVGAFGQAMKQLNERCFGPLLRRHALELNKPLIGICLGMQLLVDYSCEHGKHEGLGIIGGEVVKLKPQPPAYRVPNIGWSPISVAIPSPTFPAEVDGQSFYHVHSYHVVCSDPKDVAATFEFGGREIVTAIARNNVVGMQFHPEKSQDAGLNLLHNLLHRINSDRS